MPFVEATMAWAMPVPIEILGAHIEAYLNLLPAITTLRLIHRFSKDSPLTRLPVELLANVEELLALHERKETAEKWRTNFNCVELQCSPDDHLTEGERDAIAEKLTKEDIEQFGAPREPSCLCQGMDTRISEYLFDHIEEFMGRHHERQDVFQQMAGYKLSCDTGIFGENRELLRKHFGLDVWTSFVRINEDEAVVGEWWIPGVTPVESVIAYLILPDTEGRDNTHVQAYDLADIERDDPGPPCAREDGCGLELVPQQLTEKDREKFERALRILDLKPSRHWTQMGNDLGAKPVKTAEPKSWPRLTMLVSSGNDGED